MKTIWTFLLVFLLWSDWELRAQSQSFLFSTPVGVAGSAGWADGTNAVVRFRSPAGIAVDNSGTIYVADTENHVIRQITHSASGWVVRTVAGLAGASGTNDGFNTDARFYNPYGLAVDINGNIFVADTYNHTIREITPVGTNWMVSTLAGSAGVSGSQNGTGTSASFYFPYGVAVDQAGNLYVADTYNHAIRQIFPGGTVITIAGLAGTFGAANGANTSAHFYYPSGIAVDASGNLFVADTYNMTIREISLVGSDWVTSTPAGVPGYRGSGDGTNRSAQFSYPSGITVGPGGTLFVADTLNYTVRTVTSVGTNWVVSTVGGLAGSPGAADGPGSSARFSDPYGVAVDVSGNLYVADFANDTIRFGQPGFLLQGFLSSGQLVVSWPVAISNYVLETSSSFGPGATWTPITSGIAVSGNSYVFTNSTAPPQAFFRLHSQ